MSLSVFVPFFLKINLGKQKDISKPSERSAGNTKLRREESCYKNQLK